MNENRQDLTINLQTQGKTTEFMDNQQENKQKILRPLTGILDQSSRRTPSIPCAELESVAIRRPHRLGRRPSGYSGRVSDIGASSF